MKKHVFVVAVSTFPREAGNGQTVMNPTTYRFVDKSLPAEKSVFTYTGHYQLEPIPVFIREKFGEITDFVLLETPDTRDPKKDGRMYVSPAPDGSPIWPKGIRKELHDDLCEDCKTKIKRLEKGTAVDWYKEWLHLNFPDAEIHDVKINEHSPAKSLQLTLSAIRKLYSQTDTSEEWRLWIDTHGSFRDLSEVIATAARMIAIDKTSIRTDGIFSIYYSQKTIKRGKKTVRAPSEIVNLTPFYFSESADALKKYLNYGQYLTMQYVPCDCKDPYAFVSYRHDRDFLISVRIIFAGLQDNAVDYWFDDGIKTGEEWEKVLIEKNHNAAVFLGLLTNSYFESAECWKELLRAIADSKKKKRTFFFIIMEEKDFSLPEKIPDGSKFKEAKAIQKELAVSDLDIKTTLTTAIQHTKGFRYIPGNEQTQINERNAKSADLYEDVMKIKAALAR